jgi:hypothetical protein
VSVDTNVRLSGFCGLMAPWDEGKLRRSYVCLKIVLHDGPHEDGGAHFQWEAEMTEEELAAPIAIGTGAVETQYIVDPRAHARSERPKPEPTKQREGDQVLPTGDEALVDDQQLLIDDIEERRQVGIERYGQGHRPFNGRDTFQDLYEEQLDLLVYFRSLKRMAEASREQVIDVIAEEIKQSGFQPIVCTAMAEQIYNRLQGWVAATIMKGSND